MRRIYESDAIRRDDEPFTPQERRRSHKPQAIRWINSTRWSNTLTPQRLRRWAVSVTIETPQTEYPVGGAVPFIVTMKNSMPFPVTIPTVSPVLWTWTVDGHVEASHVPLRDPPDERGAFTFDRGERKEFVKHWPQTFRTGESEWEPATGGEYTIGAGINVDDPQKAGLYDDVTIRLVPE